VRALFVYLEGLCGMTNPSRSLISRPASPGRRRRLDRKWRVSVHQLQHVGVYVINTSTTTFCSCALRCLKRAPGDGNIECLKLNHRVRKRPVLRTKPLTIRGRSTNVIWTNLNSASCQFPSSAPLLLY
jgi:hypothetical protein